MPRTVFISYSHKQGEWVWDRLVPVLKASGVEVLVQDQAESTVIVLSPDYLKSSACRKEMMRAIDRDPTFGGRPASAIPVLLKECTLPDAIRRSNPLYVDLTDDAKNEPWEKLLAACEGALAPSPPAWLKARDECRTLLERGHSINLEVEDGTAWRALLRHLKEEFLPGLGLVDLNREVTASRQGFVEELLQECGTVIPVPEKPHDLGVLETSLKARRGSKVALTHFDAVATPDRKAEYGHDLFMRLRDLVAEKQVLTLLAVSRAPAASLFPHDHPFSNLNLQTVELRMGR